MLIILGVVVACWGVVAGGLASPPPGHLSQELPSALSSLPLVESAAKNLLFGSIFLIFIVALDRLWLKRKLKISVRELEKSRERITGIIQDAPIGIFTTTPEGTFLGANDQLSRIFGFPSPAELIAKVTDVGREIYRNPRDREEIIAVLDQEGRIFHREIEFVRRDGVRRWGNLSMCKAVDDQGVIRFEGFIQDITETKMAARTMEESQSFLEMALEVTGAGTWQYCIPTREAYHSPNWFRVLGYEPDEFEPTPENLWNITHPDDRPSFAERRREFETSRGSENWEMQVRFRNKKGDYQWVLSKGRVSLRDDAGLPVMIMGVIYDIQKFKNGENRLRLEVKAKEETKRRLEHEAYHDPLTGLGNRAKCMNDIKEFFSGQENGDFLGLLFFDIVNFGQVNQAYGHTVGDELLRAISKNLLHIVGRGALAHRVGGDQFAVLKKCRTEAECVQFGDHARESLPNTYFIQGEKIEIAFNFGIGFSNRDGEKADSILNMAVLAHNEAKKRKDGTLVSYDREVHDKENRRLTIAKNIKTGLVNGEFSLVYQPLVSARSGRLHGCEALLRW